MANKKPRKIGSTKIGWADIEIWFDPKLADEHLDGLWVPWERRIYIGEQSILGGEHDSVIHECIHAADTLYELKLSERQVRLLATALVQAWSGMQLKRKIK